MKIKPDYSLYLVTDSCRLSDSSALYQIVNDSLEGGASIVQYREKHKSFLEREKEATELKKLTNARGVPFIINDDVALALKINAQGVHIGQSDMPVSVCREQIGDKLLGVTANTLAQAIAAEKSGADYLGVGAAFATQTKSNAVALDREVLRAICQTIQIPIVIIGGINGDNLHQLSSYRLSGVAVSSTIIYADSPYQATVDLVRQISFLNR